MDVKEMLQSEWEAVRASKTFKAVVAMETGAVVVFVRSVLDGTQEMSIPALKGWLLFQMIMIIVVLLRHTLAGIEAKVEAVLGPTFVAAIEKSIKDRAIKELEAKGHMEAAQDLSVALNTPPVEVK